MTSKNIPDLSSKVKMLGVSGPDGGRHPLWGGKVGDMGDKVEKDSTIGWLMTDLVRRVGWRVVCRGQRRKGKGHVILLLYMSPSSYETFRDTRWERRKSCGSLAARDLEGLESYAPYKHLTFFNLRFLICSLKLVSDGFWAQGNYLKEQHQ